MDHRDIVGNILLELCKDDNTFSLTPKGYCMLGFMDKAQGSQIDLKLMKKEDAFKAIAEPNFELVEMVGLKPVISYL